MRVFTIVLSFAAAGAVLLIAPGTTQAQNKKKKNDPFKNPTGYTDTPYLPDGKWRVHDLNRPRPAIITPGAKPGDPPSDAVVLFNGTDLSAWNDSGKTSGGQPGAAKWKVENGYFEVVPGTGDLVTKEKFGDVQLHIEWSAPVEITGASQLRGNSGVILMGRYEIQVLDSNGNVTYADGQAGSIYGQKPPLVNASRPRGEWQSYDIIFEAPRFDGDRVAQPAYVTVLHNGVALHHRHPFIGRMAHRVVGTYAPHGAEEPLLLQNHGDKVRYRNVWMRKLGTYDSAKPK
ncbi:MAG: DUF1080 domain-containing protein [Acidobacteria bacterium]|nr:DUF1080 domain-containing protein [Acidobacteriota bacterium]